MSSSINLKLSFQTLSKRRLGAITLFALLTSLELWMPRAQGASLYTELGYGLGQLYQLSPTFGTGAPASSKIGSVYNLGLMVNFSESNRIIQWQAGLLGRIFNTTGSDDVNYSHWIPYPTFRVQMTIFYFGLGMAPVSLTRSADGFGYSSLSTQTSNLAVMGEVGALWGVTPRFSFAFHGAAHGLWSYSTYAWTLQPSWEATLSMRIYWGFFELGRSSKDRDSSEYKGWRYPFGIEKN